MKLAGLLLLPAGWVIVLAAIALLSALSLRIGFILAGVGVEVLGLVVVIRSHLTVQREKE